MTVVGTRPEIIRLSRVIAALECHLQHVLVHTGQNYDYELNQVFFDDLEDEGAGLFPGRGWKISGRNRWPGHCKSG